MGRNADYLIRSLISVILLILLCSGPAAARQGARFDRLSIEDGLSQSTVETIVQDHLGFIWIGTEDGLNRFDGYNFTIFKHDPDNPSSISSNNIWCLFVDSNGFLWVGTFSEGLNRFDPGMETFTRYLHDPSDPQSLSSNRIRAITEDMDGVLWIGTRDGGLNRLEPDGEHFKPIRHNPDDDGGLVSDNIRFVLPDSQRTLWLATDKGIGRCNKDGREIVHFVAGPAGTNSLRDNNVRHIFKDRGGTLWISTAKGLSSYDSRNGVFTNYLHDPDNPLSIASDNIRRVHEDRHGRLWVATTKGGLCRFDRSNDVFYAHVFDQTDPYSISHNSLRVIYEDLGGLLWLGTFGGGINIYDPKKQRFFHYRHDPRTRNSLSDPIIWAIAQGPRGDIWFGSNSGHIDRYDRDTGRYFHFRDDASDPRIRPFYYIRCLYWDSDGRLWVGNSHTGADCYDPGNNSSINYRHEPGSPNSLSNNNVRDIIQDRSGNMWFCTWGGGLDRLERATQTFTHFTHQSDDSNTISHNRLTSILQDSEGIFWTASSDGLNRFDYHPPDRQSAGPDSNQPGFARFYHDPADSRSLSNSYVLCIFESRNGDLWFGTMQGLSRLEKKDRHRPVFTRYFMKDGLPNDVVYGILEDSWGNLWFSTNFGLSRFNVQSGTFRNYDVRDGLHGNEFNSGAYAKTAGGTFIFGGVNGASEFHPDSLFDDPYIAPVVLTSFNIFDQPARLTQAINSLDEITLSYKDNYFSFEFASLDYSSPGRNRYAYMLEGLDKNWTNAETRRFAGYTQVKAGDYIFKVRGTNSDGVWNTAGASIRITITPPFWKTWWFTLLVVLAAGGGIAMAITYRVRQLLKFERLRSKIAADLHDDIGAGLTEISIMGEVVTRKLPDASKELVSKEIENIGETSRHLINSMTDIVWLVNPRRDSLYDLISRLGDSYKETLTPTGIQFKTHNLESLKKVRLSMDYRQHLLLIFKEAINNSLKYGGGTEIVLKAELEGKKLKMQLSDNGTGFDNGKVTSGNGLKNMQTRARQIGGSLSILSSLGNGTTVQFTGVIA